MTNRQVGEDAALSRPARVDLSALFPRPLAAATELSLTAARRRADMPPRAPWNVGGGGAAAAVGAGAPAPRKSVAAARAAAAPAATWGDAADTGAWGGGAAGAGGEGQAGAGHPKTYDVWNHNSDAMPVIELYPMEIRWAGGTDHTLWTSMGRQQHKSGWMRTEWREGDGGRAGTPGAPPAPPSRPIPAAASEVPLPTAARPDAPAASAPNSIRSRRPTPHTPTPQDVRADVCRLAWHEPAASPPDQVLARRTQRQGAWRGGYEQRHRVHMAAGALRTAPRDLTGRCYLASRCGYQCLPTAFVFGTHAASAPQPARGKACNTTEDLRVASPARGCTPAKLTPDYWLCKSESGFAQGV